jgi:uroporphyrinogen-III synthase
MGMAKQSDPFSGEASGVPVLITRPEAEAWTFASALVDRFGPLVRPLVAPLMAPQFLRASAPDGPFAALIFTSVQGVEGARRQGISTPLPAYCVGRKTAAAAMDAGFAAISADGDAEALYASIVADPVKGRLLHVRGEDARGDLQARLNAAGIATESVVVYRQEPLPLSAEATQLLRSTGRAIVVLFSPRSAELFAKALPPETCVSLSVAAMSPAVARALPAKVCRVVRVSVRPDASAMLDAVGTLLRSDPAS